MAKRGAIRSYVLALRPNVGKAEDARYTLWWAQKFCDGYLSRLHDAPINSFESTTGLGTLANQQQKRARDILRAGRAAERATGKPFNCPRAPTIADAKIHSGEGTSFAYWIKPVTGPYIPAQTHRALNRALRAGAVLLPTCELRSGKNGGLVVRVFVEYPRKEATPRRSIIGCDVGINASVARSDGYIGKSLRPIMRRTRQKRAEQQRQGHHRSSARSALKQLLDCEARKVVTLAHRTGSSIAIESLKTLGSLRPRGSIGGWARVHFGERVRQIAGETGVAVQEQHPAYTSQACLRCDHVDSKNRRGTEFQCVSCGYVAHADVVGARNVQRKARGVFLGKHKGRARNMIAQGQHLLEVAS